MLCRERAKYLDTGDNAAELAKCLVRADRTDEAIQVLERSLRKQPDNAAANHCLAVLWIHRDNAADLQRAGKLLERVRASMEKEKNEALGIENH